MPREGPGSVRDFPEHMASHPLSSGYFLTRNPCHCPPASRFLQYYEGTLQFGSSGAGLEVDHEFLTAVFE